MSVLPDLELRRICDLLSAQLPACFGHRAQVWIENSDDRGRGEFYRDSNP